MVKNLSKVRFTDEVILPWSTFGFANCYKPLFLWGFVFYVKLLPSNFINVSRQCIILWHFTFKYLIIYNFTLNFRKNNIFMYNGLCSFSIGFSYSWFRESCLLYLLVKLSNCCFVTSTVSTPSAPLNLREKRLLLEKPLHR